MKQQAVLLVFNPEVDVERIKKWIEALKEKEVLQSAKQQAFDPEFDHPTLYFP